LNFQVGYEFNNLFIQQFATNTYGGEENLVGKPEGKRPLGRPRRRWEDNINMDLQEVGCGEMDWIELAQDRDRWRALLDVGNFSTSCKRVSFSRRNVLHGVSK
jgi:hypothetical protein